MHLLADPVKPAAGKVCCTVVAIARGILTCSWLSGGRTLPTPALKPWQLA